MPRTWLGLCGGYWVLEWVRSQGGWASGQVGSDSLGKVLCVVFWSHFGLWAFQGMFYFLLYFFEYDWKIKCKRGVKWKLNVSEPLHILQCQDKEPALLSERQPRPSTRNALFPFRWMVPPATVENPAAQRCQEGSVGIWLWVSLQIWEHGVRFYWVQCSIRGGMCPSYKGRIGIYFW